MNNTITHIHIPQPYFILTAFLYCHILEKIVGKKTVSEMPCFAVYACGCWQSSSTAFQLWYSIQ